MRLVDKVALQAILRRPQLTTGLQARRHGLEVRPAVRRQLISSHVDSIAQGAPLHVHLECGHADVASQGAEQGTLHVRILIGRPERLDKENRGQQRSNRLHQRWCWRRCGRRCGRGCGLRCGRQCGLRCGRRCGRRCGGLGCGRKRSGDGIEKAVDDEILCSTREGARIVVGMCAP